jgi:hypothetical protein
MPDEPPIKAAVPIEFLGLCWIGSSYFIAHFPMAPPRLGPDHEIELKALFRIQQGMRRKTPAELAALPDDELRSELSETGQPCSIKWKTSAEAQRNASTQQAPWINEWYFAAFG